VFQPDSGRDRLVTMMMDAACVGRLQAADFGCSAPRCSSSGSGHSAHDLCSVGTVRRYIYGLTIDFESFSVKLTFERSASCTWGIRRVAHVCLTNVNRNWRFEQAEPTRSLVPLNVFLYRRQCESTGIGKRGGRPTNLVNVRSHMLHCLRAMAEVYEGQCPATWLYSTGTERLSSQRVG
jgi:hypothetical protein